MDWGIGWGGECRPGVEPRASRARLGSDMGRGIMACCGVGTRGTDGSAAGADVTGCRINGGGVCDSVRLVLPELRRRCAGLLVAAVAAADPVAAGVELLLPLLLPLPLFLLLVLALLLEWLRLAPRVSACGLRGRAVGAGAAVSMACSGNTCTSGCCLDLAVNEK